MGLCFLRWLYNELWECRASETGGCLFIGIGGKRDWNLARQGGVIIIMEAHA